LHTARTRLFHAWNNLDQCSHNIPYCLGGVKSNLFSCHFSHQSPLAYLLDRLEFEGNAQFKNPKAGFQTTTARQA